jgi:hypothetical protein
MLMLFLHALHSQRLTGIMPENQSMPDSSCQTHRQYQPWPINVRHDPQTPH